MNTPSNSTAAEPRAITADEQIEVDLMALCTRFRDEAMKVDPTVTGAMVCLDQIDHRGAVMGVMLTRDSQKRERN
jgi:hypothetical protein